MTQRNKSSLTLLFEQGDIPTGTNYADFIDSYVNVVETSVQAMAGPLSCTELITPRVSATTVNCAQFGNAVGSISLVANQTITLLSSASNIELACGSPTGQLYAHGSGNCTLQFYDGISITNLSTSTPIVIDSSSSYNLVYGNTRFVNNVTAGGGIYYASGIISAAGTAQSTAAVLTNVINRGKGVVDGSTTGFRPPANSTGLVQYLYNEGPSANLWPPVGGTINGLAANAAFSIAASSMITIVHLTASAMAAK